MCVLLVGWQLRADTPLVIAANRDEARNRPSLPPAVTQLGDRQALLPRDQVAGGTWLGVNDAGVATVITNRADGDFDPARPSRGELPFKTLSLASAAEARSMLERRTREASFNSFNLFVADEREAWVGSWNGALRVVDLKPGAYVLTNSHDLDVLPVPEFAALPWADAAWPDLLRRLQELLGDHQGRDDKDYPLCKHGDSYCTVSATVFTALSGQPWQMHFSAGNPCTTPFLQYHLSRAMTRPEAEPHSEV